MKIQISESQLNKIISESIAKNIHLLKENYFGDDFDMYETSSSEGETPKKDDKEGQKQEQVVDMLNKDGIKIAPYAYKLWPNKDKASARSLLTKKVKHEKNDQGYPYQLSDGEANKLYQALSSDSI